MPRPVLTAIVVALALPSSGCWLLSTAVDNTLDSAASSAGNRVGQRMGDQAADSVYPAGTAPGGAFGSPQFVAMYTSMIFNYAFSAGGFAVSDVPYKPGQYARFSLTSKDGHPGTLERAFLGDDASGNEWWQVKFSDDQNKQTTVLEALLDQKESKMLRLRAKFPDDKAGHELALTDQTYYVPPTHLSKDSIKGATQGIQTLTTPAGTFQARHVVFGSGNGTIEWWLNDSVPGGLVEEVGKNANSSANDFTIELSAYGDGVKSELGSLP